jgi:hypothetical protein
MCGAGHSGSCGYGMVKKYVVFLTDEDRETFRQFVGKL